jgi:hypothetical protein
LACSRLGIVALFTLAIGFQIHTNDEEVTISDLFIRTF